VIAILGEGVVVAAPFSGPPVRITGLLLCLVFLFKQGLVFFDFLLHLFDVLDVESKRVTLWILKVDIFLVFQFEN
jgi:hypothetical protein